MKFRDSLKENPAPTRLGDVRLRYDGDLLVGETPRPAASVRPTAFATIGFSCAVIAGLFVLLPESAGGTALAVVFGVAAATLLMLSTYGEQRARARRSFALNFVTETLRVDRPSQVRAAPETVLVNFDDVTAVGITGSRQGGAALWVDFKAGRELLVDAIQESEAENLVRVHRILERAFGIKPEPSANEPSSGTGFTEADGFDG